MRIVIALDTSAHSDRALDWVTRIRWPAGSRMLAVSVLQPMPVALSGYETGPALAEEYGVLRDQLNDRLVDARRRLREAGLSADIRVVNGDPRDALVELARGEHADLIVMGSHGRTGLAKLVMGSVWSHVVTHAPCSVLVVKADACVEPPQALQKEEQS